MEKNKTFFHRKIYDRLLKWKEGNGRTAMLIQGARGVGKSTLVKEFAHREYKSSIIIDFSNATKEVMHLFDDILDLNYIFLRLQSIYKVELFHRESVIVFDEVQLQPRARQAIKHLVADWRYDYIETGSLVNIYSWKSNILLPSEESRINMYPMDFEEFRWALGDTVSVDNLRTLFERKEPFGLVHRKVMRDFRIYMLVGGMPQAVATYIETNNFAKVDATKREIISLFEEDFDKIDPSGRARRMYDAIPAQLSGNSIRYQVSRVLHGEKTKRVERILIAMEDSMMINISYHSDDPDIGLALTQNNKSFKMYTSDTGLFVTLAFMDSDYSKNIIYENLFNDKLSCNLGYVYENMVAQILKSAGRNLYYHTIPYAEGKKHYEVDFVIADSYKVTPIQVKSSNYKAHKSFDEFCRKYSSLIMNRYVIHLKDYVRKGNIDYLPIYMTQFIYKLPHNY